MSIPTATFNAAILGANGYNLYKIYCAKLNASNSQPERNQTGVDSTIAPTVNTLDSELPLEKEIENIMKPLIGNKHIIVQDAKYSELSLEKATVEILSFKEIGINPNFYKIDKETCKFIVRKNINHYKTLYDYLFRALLIRNVAQLAISALSTFHKWSLLSTMGISYFVRGSLNSITGEALLALSDSEVIRKSSDEELIAAQCFYKALEQLYKRRDCSRTAVREVNHCIKEIDQRIQVRCLVVDSKEQEKKTASLKAYLQPYIQA